MAVLACACAGHGGPFKDPPGEAGVARCGLRKRVLLVGGGRGLPHAVRERDQLLVVAAYAHLAEPALLGQPLLGRREPAGVEEPAEQHPPLACVGTQKACEIALREEGDLAELFAVHAEESGDLLADLLVRTAQPLPSAVGRHRAGR